MSKDIEEIRNKITPILKEEGVSRSAIFGSYVSGEQTESSDIDILVELPKGSSLLDLVRLEKRLEGILGKKVDLLTYNSVFPPLKEIIRKQQFQIL